MPKIIATQLFFMISFLGFSQHRYWIASEDTVGIRELLGEPVVCSDWLHECSYPLSPEKIRLLSQRKIVVKPVLEFETMSNKSSGKLSYPLEQVEAEAFLEQGLNGTGVKIGIIDGGFLNANEDFMLTDFFENDRVKFYRDYITPELEPYGGSKGLDDGHGTEVWQSIGGYNSEKGILFGLARGAEYYLARTDHGGFERRIEEDLLIQALEDMDSMGVKLVNMSLGYNIDFTDPKENYLPTQMDGRTTEVARAVEIAATEKGMLIVVSAGNEGNISWQTLSTPGDAEHALTVGASKFQLWDRMNYSSIGPDYTDFVKPDVVVYSTMGTSFAAPVITGMAACLWQKDSTLTNLEILELFQKAGNFYPFPNNYVGYGVPTCTALLEVLNGDNKELPQELRTSRRKVKIAPDKHVKMAVAYHKKDATHVIAQANYRTLGKYIKVKKEDQAVRTSVLLETKVVEIYWE